MLNTTRPAGIPAEFIQAFYAVSQDRPGNNGQLNANGQIAAERGTRVLSRDPMKAQSAVDAYQARGTDRRAKVGSTWCHPAWVGA